MLGKFLEFFHEGSIYENIKSGKKYVVMGIMEDEEDSDIMHLAVFEIDSAGKYTQATEFEINEDSFKDWRPSKN